ncbi:hypothetical protein [Bacillus sp. REN10]|uniref:hypothetical protein n=1 Tax=Bacillus sp. REN10 TaxID=2782541 RepID=UPI00193AEF9A|nr:hypothetical protein [Bacillus sp. REN10]
MRVYEHTRIEIAINRPLIITFKPANCLARQSGEKRVLLLVYSVHLSNYITTNHIRQFIMINKNYINKARTKDQGFFSN